MNRGWRRAIAALLALILLLTGLILTVTQWLPRLAGIWLPANTTISLDGRPRWHAGQLILPAIGYSVDGCALAVVNNVTLSYRQKDWWATAGEVTIDSRCTDSQQSASDNDPRTLAEWQQMLPGAHIRIAKLTLLPWPEWAGELQLDIDPQRQHLHYQGEHLSVNAELQQQNLTLNNLSLKLSGMPQPVELAGSLTLPRIPNTLPQSGSLQSTLALDSVPEPLSIFLDWQQHSGGLQVKTQGHETLLMLPWDITSHDIAVRQGTWRWPWGGQPLSGGIALQFENWKQGLDATLLSGRINLLTEGRGGKGNVVLNIGPGHLSMVDSNLPLRLNGESKLAALQFYARLNGELRGALTDPQLILQPGALLRMKGRLISTLDVDEARWPLAGVRLSSAGIDGPLQAILSAHDKKRGQFRLHLDGRATDFWPDKGLWRWRYWGEGRLTPLSAAWDLHGQGRWQNSLIELTSLSTGFNRLRYGSVETRAPRLTLSEPLRWQRDAQHPAFNGKLVLDAGETRFSNGGYLPASVLSLSVKGRDPDAFFYRGELRAGAIGPVQVRGRWDGERLRGQAWWPEQPLRVFQPLIAPDLKLAVRNGSLQAQVAFSAAADQGLEAGGHWLVKNGQAQLPDNEFRGVDFSLPFRLRAHKWYFGTHGPVALRIAEIKNQFAMQEITADLQGWYPWTGKQPLRLSNVSLKVLGGSLSLDKLQMPQTEAAKIRIQHISLSELGTAMMMKQIALSGHINGELPVWLNNPDWLVKGGWIANSGPVTVRMDSDMADAISDNNLAAGAAINWLRYMEVSRSWATLDLDNLGWMTLTAKVDGTSRFSNRNQRVALNYSQRENLFQLWRSLRFGDNLQSWVEENATLPLQKEKYNELPE